VFCYRWLAKIPVSFVCVWTENCSAGGRSALPAAALVPLPPAVWRLIAVTSIDHLEFVWMGIPGASLVLRLHVRTGVLVAMLTISIQILCYWAYNKTDHESIVPYQSTL
jgi:hypothetical protein